MPRAHPILLLITALMCACSTEVPSFDSNDVDRFEAAALETHEAQGAVGTAIMVQDGSGRRWLGTLGYADRETQRTIDDSTLIRSASVAKTFNGALILALHDEGLLNVNDPVSEYTNLLSDGDRITLRMLLTHTSGLANYTKIAAYRDMIAADPRPLSYEALVRLAAAEPRDFEPGASWNYSNTGYILLGLIVESVLGQPYHEALAQRFFQPLGMHQTRPLYGAEQNVWSGYVMQNGELVSAPPGPSYPADGGYATSPADLVTWAHAFFGGRLHRPETLALAREAQGGALLTTVAQSFQLESGGYGLGLIVAEDATFGELLAGAGNADGVRTFVGYVPEQDLAFAVAVNVGDSNVPIVQTLSSAAPMIQVVRERATRER